MRFAAAEVQVDATITQDNPTVRDLLSLLPITITFEEFSGREKIGYPPRRLVTEGFPRARLRDGDLIYFAPWGNLGFYYNADGIGHDGRVVHLGTFDATPEQLTGLEAGDVTITAVRWCPERRPCIATTEGDTGPADEHTDHDYPHPQSCTRSSAAAAT